MECSNLLKMLTECMAVSGFEENMALNLKNMFKEYCDSVEIDKFYNVVGYKKGNGKNNKKIMITAHYDEIGLMVKGIDERGFVIFTNVGGIDPKILLAQEVIIHGKTDVYGIIGSKPPHLLTKEDYLKSVDMKELSIDVGYSKKEIENVISIGDAITFKSKSIILNQNIMSNKTMDNRAGVVAMIMAMERLSKVKHDFDLYFLATTQEEFNLAGAKACAYNIDPDIAIVIDACHGDMSNVQKEATFDLGKGSAIGIGPNLHMGVTKKLISMAKDEKIPYQIDVEPGNTGTECWAIQVAREGIATVLLSIPVRYMHTTVEAVHIEDIKLTSKIVSDFVGLSEQEIEVSLCY